MEKGENSMLAYVGKSKKLVKVLKTTETGAVVLYEPADEPGKIYMPLIENGKNVENFEFMEE